jgi:hypothetical protein
LFLDEAGKIRWSTVGIALGIVGALGMIAYAIYSDGKEIKALAAGAAEAVAGATQAAGAARAAGEAVAAGVADVAAKASTAIANATKVIPVAVPA